MSPSKRFLIASLISAFFAAGCSSAVEIDVDASGAEPYEVLRSAVSPCPNGPPPSDTPWIDVFSRVETWYRVDEYDGAEIPVVGEEPGELEVVAVGSGEVTTLDIVGNPGAARSLAWGVSQASAVYIGVSSTGGDYASVIMTALPDGSAFFPGVCVEEVIGDGIRYNLGDEEYTRLVGTALELTGAELAQYLSTSQQQ